MDTTPKESRQIDLWTSEFITFAAATIFIGLRLLSRRLTRIEFWWDDWFALCCYTDSHLMLSIGIKEGLGLHIHDVHNGKTIPEILMKNALILYVAELFYATALFCAKASILSFYWRMFRVTNIKLPIQILAGSALIWIIIRSENLTWNLTTIVVWASVEVNLVTVSTCIFLFTCTNPRSTINSGSNSYGHSYGRSHGRSQTKNTIRLSTLPNNKDNDESSSTHQLADSDRERQSSDFESHAMDRYRGNVATVTGPAHGRDQSEEFEVGTPFGGIMVKNETTVMVSNARPR
ncbi:hypothetical protein FGSG_05754 [Fusarium graminearum PH-1]|uniref:hypothetical protein n=1 Tax=Gibberella zeae (strain ATCC MYA-4620 / CBS 123657 / FGSC 9075 / NRRL 31084 / PH-1) TaxID=229533 RepID=UPI00021F18CD|nr:hypothetical protein FGSG_05754 [Fusarium graminearum PH-1]ESU11764.1 hypothetical protein FGSG_05754 [Fusarium graminearum PH-1]|eukprot:XP_011324340.1 hypothetical protein FGSG_05754 [Fusarium graminearum PH-1]